jgi:hypothetical protein
MKLQLPDKKGIIFMFIGVLFLSMGFYDHYKNPGCYRIERTFNNYDQKFVEGNISKAIYYNSTQEQLPKCFILRLYFYRIILYSLILYIFVEVLLWWKRLPKERKEEIIKDLENGGLNENEQEKENNTNEKVEKKE